MKTILWDFDGVILDSMKVRDWGFREIFKSFPEDKVEDLILYHRKNGGLSRYVKIRYFYESILGKEIDQKRVNVYVSNFSTLMKQKLIDKENLIDDSVNFIKQEYKNYKFHIVSGSDQEELRYLCKELGLSKYFISIHGSPTPKKELVVNLMNRYEYVHTETCLIGDSINDYEATIANEIAFFGYNNENLRDISNDSKYIERFSEFYY